MRHATLAQAQPYRKTDSPPITCTLTKISHPKHQRSIQKRGPRKAIPSKTHCKLRRAWRAQAQILPWRLRHGRSWRTHIHRQRLCFMVCMCELKLSVMTPWHNTTTKNTHTHKHTHTHSHTVTQPISKSNDLSFTYCIFKNTHVHLQLKQLARAMKKRRLEMSAPSLRCVLPSDTLSGWISIWQDGHFRLEKKRREERKCHAKDGRRACEDGGNHWESKGKNR
jgi:hypothetical protein